MDGLQYEPDPRYAPYSAVIEEQLYVWGGKLKPSPFLQFFHFGLEAWRLLRIPGPYPPGLYGGASAWWNQCLYVYGGVQANQSTCGYLYKLDTKNFRWCQLTPQCTDLPMKKWASKMIAYEHFLVLVGGRGIRNRSVQRGSEWIKARHGDDEKDLSTEVYTNEVHKFNLKEGRIN